jgi:predicted ATPase/DNA-binding CsgD family transcriptional regulator
VGESAAGTVHGFPASLTSFIGRDGPVREVVGLLEQHRRVTVTGPGGAGKTRLAGEVVKHVAGRFADGAWLAELAPVADPAQVAAVVAAALRVREQPGMPAAEAVAQVLARQQLLLVLDNCEHLIEAAAVLCVKLLLACDDVRILTTSREPLQVAGEARYRLGPLTVPDRNDLAHSATAEAVALFAARARSADTHFALDEQTGPAVARIVRRLDGMPLAIELAAARVEALGVTGLLDRLDDRFALLAGGDRMAPSRQRSLEATVEWSYQLLDDLEQRVFRAVSVFPGPFTLEAAEAVAGRDAGPAVLRLVDCSLLVPPRQGPDGRSRYLMLETLRAYGAARLAETGEHNETAGCLAWYALEVAEQAATGLASTAGEAAAASFLDAEDATMHEGLAWALEHDPLAALRLAVAVAPWWRLRGRSVEGTGWLRAAAARGVPGSDLWCAAQFWLANNGMHAADFVGALDHVSAACELVGDRKPSRALTDCLGERSVVLVHLGRAVEAAVDGRHALDLAEELGYPAGQALALVGLSMAASGVGDLDEAVARARQTRQLNQAAIPGWLARVCCMTLTDALIDAGELAAARRSCEDGLALSRQAGDMSEQVDLLTSMAMLDRLTDDVSGAGAHLHDASQLAIRIGDRFFLVGCSDEGGYLCAAGGRWAEAVTLWAACASWLGREGLTETRRWTRLHESMQQGVEALGPDRARAAEERGAAMTLETAAEFVTMLFAADPRQPSAGPGPGELSARERELVTLVAQGRTDAQIAAELFISVRTVGSHLDRIRDKTGYRRRADLTRLALAVGLV